MCGINGVFSLKNIEHLSTRLNKMNEAISHRGPDANSIIKFSDNAGMGHQRLSIIDINARSTQPMTSQSGNSTIVFNGEIFNFKEIKDLLINEYNFITESDTEVILAGYELKGVDWLINQLNGMFAFAIFDRRENKVFLARDRFGIKPLFYCKNDDCLVFSSEVKGLLSSGLIDCKFNSKAIDDYLGYRYVREPFTFFENIFQVKSAHYIEFDASLNSTEKIYWRLPSLNFSENYNENEIITNTKQEIVNATYRWLLSDVKVGTYLSGGIDSSLTTAIIAQKIGSNLDTYTIGFPEDGYNEFQYAKVVSEKYNTNHREFILDSKDYFKEWDKLIYFKDAPLAVPNEIPLALMTTGLSKDITVVISGEGADELFGGYGQIFRSAFDFSNNVHSWSTFYHFFLNQYEYVNRSIRDKYILNNENYRSHFDNILIDDFKAHRNEENIFRFFHNFHIKGLLNRVDMTTMQASVEARPPFLDHLLVEYVYKEVPYSMKLRWNNSSAEKHAVKLQSSEYSEVLDTPKYVLKKVGFPVPLTNWFPQLWDLAKDVLQDADWLNISLIDSLKADIIKHNSNKSGQLLWMFINVELFKRKYFSQKWKW